MSIIISISYSILFNMCCMMMEEKKKDLPMFHLMQWEVMEKRHNTQVFAAIINMCQ